MNPRLRFKSDPTPAGTELHLHNGDAVLPTSAWALSGHRGADLALRLILEGGALDNDNHLLVEHGAIARLSGSEAARLNLPAATSLRAVVEGNGIMLRPDFQVTLRWTRPGGQNFPGLVREGAWLREPEGWRRLSETLFAVVEAVNAHDTASTARDEGARLHALKRLRETLPQAALSGTAEASGLLGSITLVEADALSLDAQGEGNALRLVPVLHRAGGGDAPLLEGTAHEFGSGQFYRWPTARSVYALPGGTYVVVSRPLRQALDVVRRMASAPLAARRDFLREPRAAIRAAIGDEADVTLLESLVVETTAWSDRVIGLGLWEPRVLPWVQVAGNDWFGEESGPAGRAEPRGLLVGDKRIPLTPDEVVRLKVEVERAIATGVPAVPFGAASGDVDVPASTMTLRALAALAPRKGPVDEAARPEVLLIRPNEMAVDVEASLQLRPVPKGLKPSALASTLKRHQEEGLAWLQRAWAVGSPGVLLADDMGLGKTLQGLAFLVWLREAMVGGEMPQAPVLIVAPTGLLENWRAEHDHHLAAPGLGTAMLAYGKGLAALRRPGGNLDLDAMRRADWVLTTYETLRDHDRDFGAVRFAAMLLDEAQKVKTPGIRMTDAAKAMNADFRIAMTGTPVENRLADLWCIVDGVAPGHLGDLKGFSRQYEAERDPTRLTRLKALLDKPVGGRPPILLRRLKEDRLPDLPPRDDIITRAKMTGAQLAAYEEAVRLGRSDQGAGRVLEALQRLRAVSLHCDPQGATDDAALEGGSARLQLALAALDRIAQKGERALLFLDDLSLMARLASLLQRRYDLPDMPMTINGTVAGAVRQARVDRFQAANDGFDVMLLSPRAGGIGLTLTRANHVIHLSRWWNPAVEDQCTGRVLRIGQTRPVTVHVPLSVRPDGGTSFDENLHSLLSRKRQLMREALLPPEPDARELADILNLSLN